MTRQEAQKLLLWDFDGVMADTARLSFSLRKKLEPELTEAQYREYFRGNDWSAKPETTPTKKDHEEHTRLYSEGLREIPLYDKLKEVIEEFAEKYLQAIVSSTPSNLILSYLATHGVREYFFHVLGSDIDISKTRKIRKVVEAVGLIPRDTVLITDTVRDMKEAEAVGVRSIGVNWGYQSADILMEGNPYEIVSTPLELKEAVHRLFA